MKNTPKHLAIIMDGNRRWAKENGLPLFKGHHQGVEKAKTTAEWCRKRGIKILTLYVFSTENWQRPAKEVSFLMRLFSTFLSRELKRLQEEKARLLVIGDRKSLLAYLVKKIEESERLTRKNKNRVLIIALSYGGRAEMIDAIKSIVRKVENDEVSEADIDEAFVEKHLYTNGIPDPDLIIRTSGEERLSGFLIWQAAYSELYFTDVYFPEFRKIDLWRAIRTYQSRQRRFGK